MRLVRIHLLVLVLIGVSSFPFHKHTALAAEGLKCSSFTYQEDAQQLLDDSNAGRLDPDGNGIACEELPSDGRPDEIRESVKISIGYSPQFPVAQGDNYRIFLGGIGDLDLIEDARGVECADIIDRNTLETIFPDPTVVYLQDEHGEVPGESDVSDYENFVPNALLWAWNGQDDAVNLNVWLLEQGYSVYDPDTAPRGWEGELKDAQREAKGNEAGIWGKCRLPREYKERQEPEPQPTAEGLVDSVSGDGGGSGYLNISQSGTYRVTIRSYSMDAYVEMRVIDSDTGVKIPELGVVVFGPEFVDVWVYFEEGQHSVTTSAVGHWSITVFQE